MRFPMRNFAVAKAFFSTMKTQFSTTSLHNNLKSLNEFGLTAENSLLHYLIPEEEIHSIAKPQFTVRQISYAHYTYVKPEPVTKPYFIAASKSCAVALGLNPIEFSNPLFVEAFSGNKLLPGLDFPYCTIYGCHCYGQWFGQLGDGRAMGLGEVQATADEIGSINGSGSSSSSSGQRLELQLKGCGRSPYSRGFDGRAVLRSSVREFLVSEAMHHLGVPTTRALSVIGTSMTVRRPWYDVDTATSTTNSNNNGNGNNDEMNVYDNENSIAGNGRKYPPNILLNEPGAVVCRVSPSFLRVSQLELFAKRKEIPELIQLADYVCLREFPHLLTDYSLLPSHSSVMTKAGDDDLKPTSFSSSSTTTTTTTTTSSSSLIPPGPPERYIEMFKLVIHNNAYLMTEWLRVGYTQGNMNSDNTLLAGRSIDYGPYGWLEQFDPYYQPFTSDSDGKFSFYNQPNAMNVNMAVLGESIEVLVKGAIDLMYDDDDDDDNTNTNKMNKEEKMTKKQMDVNKYISQIRLLAKSEYQKQFLIHFNRMRGRKLGFSSFSAEKGDEIIWSKLMELLYKSKADYTIFFRELSKTIHFHAVNDELESALEIIQVSFYASSNNNNDNMNSVNNMNKKKLKDNDYKLEKELTQEWMSWFEQYLTRVHDDITDNTITTHDSNYKKKKNNKNQDDDDDDDRTIESVRQTMNQTNPKYVLRNWMAVKAYDRASQGDNSVIEELQHVLESPYDEQSTEVERKWYRKTPLWAANMPGASFMSCSS